jgi:simple sugar transport system ATP-binding protein
MQHIAFDQVTKSFGGSYALNRVSLGIEKGEIHAILGENGAGKTTLMNVLYGLYQPDEGQILLDGTPIRMAEPNDAIMHGIGMIHQHFMLVDTLSVAENVILGLAGGFSQLNITYHETKIREMGRAFGLEVDPRARIWTLPMGMRQRVEILKTLYRKAKILIFDEPTSVLTPSEIDAFLTGLRRLRDADHTILFISHKLEEVLQVADRVTVMRSGQVVDDLDAKTTTAKALAHKMVGRDLSLQPARRKNDFGEVLLDLQNLIVLNDRDIRAVDGLSLQVRAGEVLGVAGVDGNGQRELSEAIVGLRNVEAGRIVVEGEDVTELSVKARTVKRRMNFVPEDRQATGLVLDYPVCMNFILRNFDQPPTSRGGLLNFPYIRRLAKDLVVRYGVRVRTIDEPTRFLSGGNQQKIILAREIESRPKILIAMQACRGLDVGAIEFVQNTILDLKAQGVAVLYISTELEHILTVADRIAVMYRGRVAGLLDRDAASATELGRLMAGIPSANA